VDSELYINELDKIEDGVNRTQYTEDDVKSSLNEGMSSNLNLDLRRNSSNNSEKSSPINFVNSSTPLDSKSSPINTENLVVAPNNSTNVESTPSVTSKSEILGAELQTIPSESKEITVNLESAPIFAGNADTNIIPNVNALNIANQNTSQTNNSQSSINNQTTTVSNSKVGDTVNSTDTLIAASTPVINSKKETLNNVSMFSQLKNSVLNSAKELIPTLKNEAANYLKVGYDKVAPVINPIINTIDTISNNIKEKKEGSIVNNTVNSTVSSPTSSTNKLSSTESTTQTTIKSPDALITVDSNKPMFAGDAITEVPVSNPPVVQAPSSENTQAAVSTTNNTNTVTYGDATQLATPPPQQISQLQPETMQQVSTVVSQDISELVNEMRSIKMLLLGGIEVTHKS
jgi:hypothetical protein